MTDAEREQMIRTSEPSENERFLLGLLDEARTAFSGRMLLRRSDVSHYCQHERGRAHMCICHINEDHGREQCSREPKDKQ